jgi:hypothetical protein
VHYVPFASAGWSGILYALTPKRPYAVCIREWASTQAFQCLGSWCIIILKKTCQPSPLSKAETRGTSARDIFVCARDIFVIVVPPVDLVGPLQVFSAANRLARQTIYSVQVVTTGRELDVPGEAGVLTFLAQRRLQDVAEPSDSALLVCGLATRHAHDARLFAWLKRAAPRLRRLGAVCVGAFLLADAGLPDGKRATAHWRFGSQLAISSH